MALIGTKKTTAPAKKVTKETKEPAAKSMKDLYAEGGAAKTKTSSTSSAKKEPVKYAQAYRVLERPVITEKAAHLGTENKYVFKVSLSANKIEVGKAVASVYGVKVEKVNLIRMQGKVVTRGRIKGKRKDYKKAIVTLAKGESIKLYEGV